MKTPKPLTDEEQAFRDKMCRRIVALEALEDYRLLHMFDVEQAIGKAWNRLLKQFGMPTPEEAPDVDWVAMFQAGFKEALARELTLRVTRQILNEKVNPMPSKTREQAVAMRIAAAGKSSIGIPKSVGKDFVAADKRAGKTFKKGRRKS